MLVNKTFKLTKINKNNAPNVQILITLTMTNFVKIVEIIFNFKTAIKMVKKRVINVAANVHKRLEIAYALCFVVHVYSVVNHIDLVDFIIHIINQNLLSIYLFLIKMFLFYHNFIFIISITLYYNHCRSKKKVQVKAVT